MTSKWSEVQILSRPPCLSKIIIEIEVLVDPIGIKSGEEILDIATAEELSIEGEKIYFDNSEESLTIIRHSCAHLLAQALKDLYPDAKFFVGPVIEDGFYYDFRVGESLTLDDLPKIEKRMKELSNKGSKIEKYVLSRDEGVEKFREDDLKIAVISKIESDELSIYKQGDFEDLCRGPHLPHTKMLSNFKLTKISGAYLGGKEGAEMLTRIYGVAFADKDALKEYITRIEEAKKRDHRKIGHDISLFKFDEDIGGGLPLWLPNGSRLRSKLENILYKAMRKRGYEPVRGPEILKSQAWKISGHYYNYKENMYFTQIDDEDKEQSSEYGIKPMNCVGHIKIYQDALRSYRDLPLKFFEFGVVHRHEKSGVLHGLLRVREFTQDDAHIFCTKEQVKDVILEVIDLITKIMATFGFSFEMELSTKPDNAIGEDAIWEEATKIIEKILKDSGHPFAVDEGGGAFYGPKIDFKITDAIGRKWQCGTIQIDLNLPERFDLEYVDENNNRARPIMIHRAAFGSFERFIAILIEHYAGEFPFFIAPTQIIIIPIAAPHQEYAKELKSMLMDLDIDVDILDRNESLNKRVRNAEKQKVPMIVVIGDAEVAEKRVAIRDRRKKEQYNLSIDEFKNLIKENMSEVGF